MHKAMLIKIEDGIITVNRPSEEKLHKSLHGLTRTLVNNMVEGVTKGFEKVLEINGVGFRAVKQGKKLTLTLGYSHLIEMEDPDGITVDVPAPNKLIVRGIDKQAVGEYAAKIRSKRKPEVYKGKGIKYETEVIRRKEGKTGGKGKK
jgi:large subunit ribosomal protein L6